MVAKTARYREYIPEGEKDYSNVIIDYEVRKKMRKIEKREDIKIEEIKILPV